MTETRKICTLDNEIEARTLEAILEQHGIPHILHSYHDSAYDGLFQSSMGWGHVEAAEEHAARILEILADLKGGASG